VPTARGVRILEGDAVLSEVLRRPGPTHSIYDVLAAAAVALAAGPRVAVLGFAAGGLVAPLRALGFAGPIAGVDLSLAGARVFERLSRGWGGPVRLARDDAARWAARGRTRYDVLIEDLSIAVAGRATKPRVSVERLPPLVRRRLAPRGIAVTNLLPVAGMTWAELVGTIARPHRRAVVVTFREWENRIVIAGQALAPARDVSRRLHDALRRIGSRLAEGTSVRTW
jgi:hypothetical protein